MENQNVPIPPTLFGTIHWVMLLRVESWAVMNNGEIQKERMSTNYNKRPPAPSGKQWDKMNSTHLNNGYLVEDHDDWDCLDDLIGNGFVQTEMWKNKKLVKLTEKGFQTFVKLRKFRQKGKKIRDFQYE
jgi:hypothetical protein